MRTIIIANGTPPTAADLDRWLKPGDRLICADGGGRAALAAGLKPDLVIGDFDSLSEVELAALTASGAALERHPRQKDATDLELALRRALVDGATDIVVLGGLGGRLDHTLANAMLLALPGLSGGRARMAGGAETLFVIRSGETLALNGQTGDTVSLLPLGEAAGIVTSGLAYPLRNEALRVGPARGVSNEMYSTRATIRLGTGFLLCIHIRREAGQDSPPISSK
ncbi:MAG TPA: thiamine diphosphokinase [Thermoflexales bacterium]|jgi:thiamine pyrophosphokinase|nr:thiamine diphosphokinase [Anaerolineae bacterium]HQV29002.1 thiamine diphosphokinase [Thermoflexales bacterium]HQX11279.1 thiamine diphosphokinase [Thermoflexales bacterium]HQY25248.1 thiamine diphosphokinase [Thermoflexales bacterium]HQZ54111.1 thiamine diphosphokinase [Thermoflexales bacterium]